MSVTTYRYDKIITAVTRSTEMSYAWGMPQEEDIIVITWTENKTRRKKVKPMMGDDYTIEEKYQVVTKERMKFTQEKFDELTERIGKPRIIRHSEDPLNSKD